MDSTKIFIDLRNAFANLYPDEISARRIATDAHLNLLLITFSGQAINNWHAILTEAAKSNYIFYLVEIGLSEYKSNEQLYLACDNFRQFIAQGGRVEPPSEAYFRKDDKIFVEGSALVLIFHLQEWKSTHDSVQKLFMEVLTLEKMLSKELSLDTFGEASLREMEGFWFRHIEQKSRILIGNLKEFQYIQSRLLDDLYLVFHHSNEEYVLRRIQSVNISDKGSIQRLIYSIYQVVGLLDEALRLANQQIVEIAAALRSKFDVGGLR